MKTKIMVGLLIAALLTGAGLAAGVIAAEQNRGAALIQLNGRQKGPVQFPHGRHQETLVECKLCHDMFPQEKGIIDTLKDNGTLQPKQVMNHCRECHRAKIQAGLKAGPTACSQCHQKP